MVGGACFITSVQGAVATWSNMESRIAKKYRMLIIDQVATAPCTDPVQVRLQAQQPGRVFVVDLLQNFLRQADAVNTPAPLWRNWRRSVVEILILRLEKT